MILHLLSDDKFSDYAISQFNAIAPDENKFVILTYSINYSCKFVKQTSKAEIIVQNSRSFDNLCNNLNEFKAIIFHSLNSPDKEQIINSAPPQVKIAWFFWGYELYNRKDNVKNFLEPRTLHCYNTSLFRNRVKSCINFIKKGKFHQSVYEIPIDVFNKVDFCITHIHEDFIYAKKYLKGTFNWAWYNYYSIEETIGVLKDKRVEGNNILIGNSATETNNHLEVFHRLKNYHLDDRKVIVPLSYGSSVYYKKVVEKKGRILLKENFKPLLIFMSLEEYNRHILSCSVVIMNHHRQQAMGNLITALWLGAKVFMSERSTAYAYFKRLGMYVLSIENELKPGREGVLNRLDEELVVRNRKILFAEYGKEKMNKRITELIDTLIK